MTICSNCGDEFQIKPGARGRPRRRCYKCAPERSGQYERRRAKERKQGKQVQVAKRPFADGPHCPHCGAYPPPGETFCNPAHRSAFAEKVAEAQDKQRIRHAKGPHSHDSLGRRISARPGLPTSRQFV